MKSIMLSLFICLAINLLCGQISLDQPLPPPPPPPPPSPPSEQVEIDVSHENIKLEEDKHILIPYNNHGEWGYCDTLGNQLISSQFQEASFFRYKIKEIGITQECARVQTSYGTNYIRLNGSWVFPELKVITTIALSIFKILPDMGRFLGMAFSNFISL